MSDIGRGTGIGRAGSWSGAVVGCDVGQKVHRIFGEVEDVAVPEGVGPGDPAPVHVGAVLAAQIPDDEAVFAELDRAVTPREAAFGDLDPTVLAPADHTLVAGSQLQRKTLQFHVVVLQHQERNRAVVGLDGGPRGGRGRGRRLVFLELGRGPALAPSPLDVRIPTFVVGEDELVGAQGDGVGVLQRHRAFDAPVVHEDPVLAALILDLEAASPEVDLGVPAGEGQVVDDDVVVLSAADGGDRRVQDELADLPSLDHESKVRHRVHEASTLSHSRPLLGSGA
jgi:hypothetical protein